MGFMMGFMISGGFYDGFILKLIDFVARGLEGCAIGCQNPRSCTDMPRWHC